MKFQASLQFYIITKTDRDNIEHGIMNTLLTLVYKFKLYFSFTAALLNTADLVPAKNGGD